MEGRKSYIKNFLFVMDRISRLVFLSEFKNSAEYLIEELKFPEVSVSIPEYEQSRILEQLEELHAIKIVDKKSIATRKSDDPLGINSAYIPLYVLRIREDDFRRVYISFKDELKAGNTILKGSLIILDYRTNTIKVDEESINIKIFKKESLLCKSLFTKPNKKWDNVSLIKNTDEDPDFLRKSTALYDAHLRVNRKARKVGISKLILYQNKNYFLNPDFRYGTRK